LHVLAFFFLSLVSALARDSFRSGRG
jgi:hypothetical protein